MVVTHGASLGCCRKAERKKFSRSGDERHKEGLSDGLHRLGLFLGAVGAKNFSNPQIIEIGAGFAGLLAFRSGDLGDRDPGLGSEFFAVHGGALDSFQSIAPGAERQYLYGLLC